MKHTHYRTNNNHRRPDKSSYRYPKLSVVVPACNEATLLPLCLRALAAQDYKGEYEVIVVDNVSTDATSDIAKEFHTKVIYEATPGVVYARRAGFAAATGSIVASTDADTIVPTDWLSALEIVLRDSRYDGVVGAYDLWNLNSVPKKIVQTLVPLFRWIDRLCGAHFAGANFAVRKSAYDAVGGFNTDFQTGEDLDLSYRLRKAGFELKVAYYICVRTSARRLNEGVYETFSNYILKNWCSLVLLHHPHLRRLTIVREEQSEVEERIL